MMSGVNYLFVAVVAALFIGAIKGYRKGFLRLVVSLASLIVVVLIVTKISPLLTDILIDNTSIYESVRHKIVSIYNEQNNIYDNSIAENQNKTINSYDLPDLISTALVNNNNEDMYSKLAATLFEEYISGYIAKIVIKAGSFCGLFILFGIAMCCLLAAIHILEKIPVLKSFNRWMGVFAGLFMSLIFVWIFFIAVLVFFGDSIGVWMFAQIKNSSLLSFLFNNNLLFQIIIG